MLELLSCVLQLSERDREAQVVLSDLVASRNKAQCIGVCGGAQVPNPQQVKTYTVYTQLKKKNAKLSKKQGNTTKEEECKSI